MKQCGLINQKPIKPSTLAFLPVLFRSTMLEPAKIELNPRELKNTLFSAI